MFTILRVVLEDDEVDNDAKTSAESNPGGTFFVVQKEAKVYKTNVNVEYF